MKLKMSAFTLILLLSAILMCTPLLAGQPQLKITGDQNFDVILKPTPDMSSYEFGFSTTPVVQWNSNPVHSSGKFTLNPYLDHVTGDSFATVDESLKIYVYWKMYTLKGITLNLSIPGPLAIKGAPESTPKLDWYVFWGSAATVSEDASVPAPAIELEQPKLMTNVKEPEKAVLSATIRKFDRFLTLQTIAGSIELKIVTGSLEGMSVSGMYEGSIQLEVVVTE